ncbi:MAG: hypothetical protein HBSAPP03_20750 [Phycisphaerae bacterium]|nr:MAG: hypothetical protein HBSAPP03_20750 [Phycisphaerae bacterium]
MVKILRKNKQWFLAAFGVLLLITFLFTGTSSMFRADPSKAKVAYVGTVAISAGEFDAAQREYEILKDLAPHLMQLQLGVESGTHWQLLVREAQRGGFIGEAGDGRDWMAKELPETEAIFGLMWQYRESNQRQLMQLLSIPAFTQPEVDRVTQAMTLRRPDLAAHGRMSLDQFDLAVAKLRGVVRMLNAYSRAARISDKQVITDAKAMADAVYADAIIIPATRIAQDAPTPSEAEVVGHFEIYKNVNPGEGERGFGYIQPRRVKLEYLHISRAAVGQAILLDPIAVNKFYQQHRADFKGEFAAERVAVEQRLRDTRTDELLQQWDSVYKSRLKSALRGVPADAGVRILPSDWAAKRPTMETLARDVTQVVSDASGVPLPLPTVRVLARDWTRLDEAASIPVIGQATLAVGAQKAPLAKVLEAVHEFTPTSSLGLQAGVPFDHFLASPNGDRFYVCILETRQPGPPDSLDEVRTRIVRDLRLSWAFDTLAAQLPELKDLAVREGLAAVGQKFAFPTAGVPPIEPVTNLQITKDAVYGAAPSLDEPHVREAVLNVAGRFGMLAAPSPETLAERTMTFELPRTLSHAVVQVTYPRPFTTEDLRMLSRASYQQLLRTEVAQAAPDAPNPFSLANLRKRLEYREVAPKPADLPTPTTQ